MAQSSSVVFLPLALVRFAYGRLYTVEDDVVVKRWKEVNKVNSCLLVITLVDRKFYRPLRAE